jgi:hypothetical protein
MKYGNGNEGVNEETSVPAAIAPERKSIKLPKVVGAKDRVSKGSAEVVLEKKAGVRVKGVKSATGEC